MPEASVYFESGGAFITAKRAGEVLIRCNFELTDCRGDESLDLFVARHGGGDKTAEYLKQCYRAK